MRSPLHGGGGFGTRGITREIEEEQVQVSYLTLRKFVGVLGMLLPVVLALGGIISGETSGVKSSISVYYDSPMRDVFVGVLFTVGWFFFSYRGYDRADNFATHLAGVCALAVALFPSVSPVVGVRVVHYVAAGLLFVVLACISLFLFTQSEPAPTSRKRLRNKAYTACGVIMLLCVVVIVLYKFLLADRPIAAYQPAFWLESVALWAFGISWLIKGETLWQDVTGEH
jgi:hypothetical protein